MVQLDDVFDTDEGRRVAGRADAGLHGGLEAVVDAQPVQWRSDHLEVAVLDRAAARRPPRDRPRLAVTVLNLVLLAARDRREQDKIGRYVRQGHADGVILMSLHSDDLLPEILAGSHVPLVLSGRPLDDRPVCYVDAGDVGGATATEHLLALGRSRIATITGRMDMVAGQDRFAGFGRPSRASAGPST